MRYGPVAVNAADPDGIGRRVGLVSIRMDTWPCVLALLVVAVAMLIPIIIVKWARGR